MKSDELKQRTGKLKILEKKILRMLERSDLQKLSIFNSQSSIQKGV